MNEIDDFLQFLFDHNEDDRIEISKEMKYGHRYYYISFNIDEEPEQNANNKNSFNSYTRESIDFCIDNRNVCINITQYHEKNIIIEDEKLVKKWSDILEEYIQKENKERLNGFLEKSLAKCYNKNFYREVQMKKILPDNESL